MISEMRIKCESCGIEGQLQHLSENYFRVKHYLGTVDGKLKFEYHKQSLAYVKSIRDAPEYVSEIDPKTIDLNLNNNGISFENKSLRSSSSWLGHKPSKLAIPGSNPGDRTNHLHSSPSF